MQKRTNCDVSLIVLLLSLGAVIRAHMNHWTEVGLLAFILCVPLSGFSHSGVPDCYESGSADSHGVSLRDSILGVPVELMAYTRPLALYGTSDEIRDTVFVFVSARYFTDQNVRKIAAGLDRKYRTRQRLTVFMSSNRKFLDNEIYSTVYEGPMCLQGAKTDFASHYVAEERSIVLSGYYRAAYWRNESGTGLLRYSPDPDDEGLVGLPLGPKSEVGPQSSLCRAAAQGDAIAISALLGAGVAPGEACASGCTPLLQAARSGRAGVAELLLAHGADVDGRSLRGVTPLMEAALRGHVTVMHSLLRHGASLSISDALGRTPLILAALAGQDIAVARLLRAGAGIDVAQRDGRTALMRAAANGHAQTVRVLLRTGARTDLRDRAGRFALMMAYDDETIRAIAGGGAEINAKDDRGWTVLMQETYFNRRPKIKALLEMGADVNAVNNDGKTALQLNSEMVPNLETLELLQSAGAR
jgi:ankyrin repeat protein